MQISLFNLNFYLLILCVRMHKYRCLSIYMYTICVQLFAEARRRHWLSESRVIDSCELQDVGVGNRTQVHRGRGSQVLVTAEPSLHPLTPPYYSPSTILNEWAAASFDPQGTVCQPQLNWPNMGTQNSTFSLNSPGNWIAQTCKQVSDSLRPGPQFTVE